MHDTAHQVPRNAAGLLANPDEIRDEEASAMASLFGVAYSSLAITPSDAYLAPEVVRHAMQRFATYDAVADLDLSAKRIIDCGDALVNDFPWQHAADAMHQHAATALGYGLFTIGLGGDHSVSWPLVTAFARQHGRVGIIQLDAHHDVRPYDEGVTNGCPIRGLVDDGIVDGGDVVQVGILPFSNGAGLASWCDGHDVIRYGADEVRRRGAVATARRALAGLSGCDAIYLTVDIDVLDRSAAPGTSAAAPGGLQPHELFDLVRTVCENPAVQAMDIVEFDPSRDIADITAYAAAQVVLTAVSSVAMRDERARRAAHA